MKRIVCFHLFNDYSGSPKVLHQILENLLQKGYCIDLITSRGGILDTLKNNDRLRIHYYNYHYSENAIITMISYFRVQLHTFFFAFKYLFKKDVRFYINTLLPIGPAISGKLMGKQVVYHYHENASTKGFFYKSLSWGMQHIASKIICVSTYQRNFLKRQKKVAIIPNTLPQNFSETFNNIEVRKLPENKIVLMLSSLKLYKGILEFMQLAQQLPQYTFHLVINDTQNAINLFLSSYNISVPKNLNIFDRQDNVISFYEKSTLVLNLSNKKQFVETFGLTVLEAMTAALPVIVPTEGGIAEMVEDGINGYKIDVQDIDEIKDCINKILSDPNLYSSLSANTKQVSKSYDADIMCKKIVAVLK